MNKKVIRMTESDLRNIVKESVGKVINEIGDTPKGQRALGALSMRHALRNPKYDARDTESKEAKIYDYAKKARGEENGEKWDYANRKWDNPLHTEYEKGGTDYLNSHTDELAAAHRRARMGESRIIREWEDGFDTTIDDDDNIYYGNYSFATNSFKPIKSLWVLTHNDTANYLFLNPQEAAQYTVAEIQDSNIEADINEEQLFNEIMANFEEREGWTYENYECYPIKIMQKKL